jgi:hypothetical protein
MLKQRIDNILNTDLPAEQDNGSGSKQSKSDFELQIMQDTHEFNFSNPHISPFGQPNSTDLCSLRAEDKHSLGDSLPVGDGDGDTKTADRDADALLRDQEAAAAFTNKLKDEHRTGLNKLKSALSTNRAQKIGDLKILRKEKEENGEPVLEIEKRIHALTEGSHVYYYVKYVLLHHIHALELVRHLSRLAGLGKTMHVYNSLPSHSPHHSLHHSLIH